MADDNPDRRDDGRQALMTFDDSPERFRNSRPGALAKIDDGRVDAAILDVNLGRNATCEAVAEQLRRIGVPFLLHSGDLVRQGELIARIDAEVIPKPAASDAVARRALDLARDAPDR